MTATPARRRLWEERLRDSAVLVRHCAGPHGECPIVLGRSCPLIDESDVVLYDNLVSPRAGVVFKPVLPVSIYTSYSVSYLPSSGDQFSSLTTVTRELEPEKFRNYEVGLKWEAMPSLSMTTAGTPGEERG